MENALQIFDNQDFGKLRTVMIDNVVWFVGKDVCEALAYQNSRDILKKHVDPEDKTREYQIDTPSGKQTMTLINESGLYSLIMRSKLPTAKKFKRWVTSEVLPSIRKTGAYISPSVFDDPNWIKVRVQSKETYKDLGTVKKLFITYARSQGYDGDDGFIYGSLAIKTNRFVELPKRGGRDKGSIPQLNVLSIIENGMKNILTQGMADNLHYTSIIAKVDVWLENFRKNNFIDSYLNLNLLD